MKHLILTLITAGILALAAPVSAQDNNIEEDFAIEINILSGCLKLCAKGYGDLDDDVGLFVARLNLGDYVFGIFSDHLIEDFFSPCLQSCASSFEMPTR